MTTLLLPNATTNNATRTQPPHLLFILADDLGYNDVSYHNHHSGSGATWTPNIDALAAESTILDSYYANPICSPSRASIMTGRYTIRLGINHHCYETSQMTGLPRNERLMPAALREAGYETWFYGKWHLGCAQEYMLPTNRGFDYHYGFYSACVDAFNHTVGNLCGNASACPGLDWHRSTFDKARNATNTTEERSDRYQHTTHLLVRDFEARVANYDGVRPIFTYLAFHMVHQGSGKGARSWPGNSGFDAGEMQAPPSYVAAVPQSVTDPARRVFVAMVHLLDEAVGNVTAAMRRAGLWERTLTVFTSDNGAPFDERGSSGNLPLRGQKHTLWEGGVRVPAFLHGPAIGVPAGKVTHRLVAHVDWLPTLLLRGQGSLSQPLPLDGVDQWAALTDPSAPAARTELLHNYDISSKPVKHFRGALRVGDLKLLRQLRESSDVAGVAGTDCDKKSPATGGAGGGGTMGARSGHVDMLYNITADPSESHDLINEPALAQALTAMRARLDHFKKATVPCWCDLSSSVPGKCAGTGYTGNCDVQPASCTMSAPPDHYGPGWCKAPKTFAVSPSSSPSPTPSSGVLPPWTVLALSALPTAASSARSPPPPPPQCILQKGVQYVGSDVATPTVQPALTECCTSCSADHECVFFT